MSQHTPRPWSWVYHPDTHRPIALTSGKIDVLLATGDGETAWVEVSAADARLIGAAPEFYESHEPDREGPEFLEFIADRLVHIHGDPEHADFVLALRRRASKARSAIAKAEGRAS